MKRTRFGSRDRISRDAAELQRLAAGLSESGGKLEDAYWERQLAELVENMLRHGAEDDLNSALDRLFDLNPRAHDELADMVESRAETTRLEVGGQSLDVLLFAAPILAWSRFSISSGTLPRSTTETVAVQLGAHVFASDTRIALADYLFSPDQLPRSFCDTWQLTRELGLAALEGKPLAIDTANLPETNRFLSDVRYLVGAVVLPPGRPVFRWNEKDGSKEVALKEWIRQGSPSLEPLLTGCAWQPLLADAYHSACRQADRASRPYSVKASVAFLQTVQGITPADLRAVVGPCYDRRLEEFRVGFGPRDKEDIWHGVVWPLLGAEDEASDAQGEIETVLRECGVKDVVIHDHRFPMEFCDDCGAPMYPNPEGELVHAEMPEQPAASSQVLH
ncbi:MAG TPA: DUF2863 family protein [Rhodocyclaceae bacterium]|jgi:hypothetical protein|nr:DUF2863 family protein [Rhodocyclaceae bacterium]HMV20902.1 DUF2863 family protein [Rhodocyclaceae bacterium]HMW77061.1 DUF2863 family protein [Rhodocyclaceae bacterium]HNE44107.1 DUF2863 family protein [Rhodocyclaceae bacterium]HNL22610.1 DUF2863 family protein [Rhodocyclaceae bacterium]